MPPGQPKLKSNDVVKDVARQWRTMDPEAKVTVTDPLLEELKSSREEVDTKPKIAPVHVLNDVSAMMTKINREVCGGNVPNAQCVMYSDLPTAGCLAHPYGL